MHEHNNAGDRIERSDLEQNDVVMMKWSPYGWFSDGTGLGGCLRVRVDVAPADDIAGDGRLVVEGSGEVLRDYGGGRRYVSGPAGFNPDTPDRTDVGMGATYYEVEQ